jgi:multisubunit Na+/H+ antiporter MnhF subunit
MGETAWANFQLLFTSAATVVCAALVATTPDSTDRVVYFICTFVNAACAIYWGHVVSEEIRE